MKRIVLLLMLWLWLGLRSSAGSLSDINTSTSLAASASALDKSLIVIEQHSADSDVIYPHLLQAMVAIPSKVKNVLNENGVSVRIVPTLAGFDPSLATNRSSGNWEGAAVYHNVRRSVLIAEKYKPEQGDSYMLSPSRWAATSLHELGHAWDCALHHLCKSTEFVAAYAADVGEMDSHQQAHFARPLAQGEHGRHEMFANMFMNAVCERNGFKQPRPDVSDGFPRSYALVKRLID